MPGDEAPAAPSGSGGGGGGGGTSGNTANLQWKAPTVTHQQKYSLQPLPDDFECTPEEQTLLNFYDTIRSYERQAARLKDAAARKRLADREAEFQKQHETTGVSPGGGGGGGGEAVATKKKKKKRHQRRKIIDMDGGMDSDSGDDVDESMASDGSDGNGDEGDDDSDDNQQSSYERREAKLQRMREEVEAKMGADAEVDARRQSMLQASNDDMVEDGPALKRKKIDDETQPKSSLIANLGNMATPPHEFSKSLELTALNGKKLFPTSAEEISWAPSPHASGPDDGALTLELDAFDVSQAQNGMGNNTCAIKFMTPEEAKRFSINIAGPDHNNFHSVLFHFNPRHYERGGQLVLNNKQEGMWGQAVNVPLSTIPLIFGQTSCALIIQINGEGFDVFLNDKHIARLEHRRELASGKNSLFLNLPATDDYNNPENWVVYKVWWGNRPIMAKGDLSGVPGYKSFNSLHPRKLFISKLSKIHTDPEVDLRRAELERAFRKYGGDRGVTVLVPKNSTFAFVEMESERQADLALQEMANQYRINRARRTRHEALQEERAAAELGKVGKAKESTDWE